MNSSLNAVDSVSEFKNIHRKSMTKSAMACAVLVYLSVTLLVHPATAESNSLAGLAPGNNATANRYLAAAWVAVGKNNFHIGLEQSALAIKADPSLGQAYLLNGLSLYELDRAPESIAPLKRGIKLLPDEGRSVMARPASEPAYSRHLLAVALTNTGRPDEALSVLKTALAIFPKSPLINTDLGDYYLHAREENIALTYYAKGAEYGFNSARERRSNIYLKLGKYVLALADANKLLQSEPNHTRYLMLRSNIYRKMGNIKMADLDEATVKNQSLSEF
jgi:tetratricopeptide (TPR) repeat protein